MSRSGYNEGGYCESQWAYICWRGAVASGIRGARGQSFLRELVAALDALPEKRLITEELESADGAVCAIGAVGKARKTPMAGIDPHEAHDVAVRFGISYALACEIVHMNDEFGPRNETPESRWQRMRDWAVKNIRVKAKVRDSA